MKHLLLAAVAVVTAAVARDDFHKYPPAPGLAGPSAPIRLNSKPVRRFRTVLRQAAAEGPNFNGHYRIAHWGTGTNAIEWGVIDLGTGNVWVAPDVAASCWAPNEPGDLQVPDWFGARLRESRASVVACGQAALAAIRRSSRSSRHKESTPRFTMASRSTASAKYALSVGPVTSPAVTGSRQNGRPSKKGVQS